MRGQGLWFRPDRRRVSLRPAFKTDPRPLRPIKQSELGGIPPLQEVRDLGQRNFKSQCKDLASCTACRPYLRPNIGFYAECVYRWLDSERESRLLNGISRPHGSWRTSKNRYHRMLTHYWTLPACLAGMADASRHRIVSVFAGG